MEMTNDELCIHACKYAVGEMVMDGSYMYVSSGEKITWEEVMEWLNREQKRAEALKNM